MAAVVLGICLSRTMQQAQQISGPAPSSATPMTMPAEEPASVQAFSDGPEPSTAAPTGPPTGTSSALSELVGLMGKAVTAGKDVVAGTAGSSRPAVPRAEGASSTCLAGSTKELRVAVADDTCLSILLTNSSRGAYELSAEIVISRGVAITGSPLVLPVINATNAERAFNVSSGGYLELRHVRVSQGSGRLRPRYGDLPGLVSTKRRCLGAGTQTTL